MHSTQKTLIITPMDWGLGHATRCVPIIERFLDNHWKVIIAGSGRSAIFLKSRFPNLEHESLSPLNINYGSKGWIWWDLIRQGWRFAKTMSVEHHQIGALISKHHANLLISDNRYGCYSTDIPSIIISHQLRVKGPYLPACIANKFIFRRLRRFNRIWVPDEAILNISGTLSQSSKKLTIEHIGLLSRFVASTEQPGKYTYLGLVSGPENQRSLFQEKLLMAFKASGKKAILLCGLPDEDFDYRDENVRIISHANDDQIQNFLAESQFVVSRSGYSSIMDLICTHKSALLVPTPGQSEQIYLANHMNKRYQWPQLKQSDISAEAISNSFGQPSKIPEASRNLLTELIQNIKPKADGHIDVV